MALLRNSRGSAVLEFTLVGIPLIFVLIGTFEMARAMWTYHTLAYTVKEGARLAIVKGSGCVPRLDESGHEVGNHCSITVADLMNRMRTTGIGLEPGVLNLYLTSAAGTVTCEPMQACMSNTTTWPPINGANEPGQDITIRGVYPFRSALAMFWPGNSPVSFGVFNMPAAAMETIQF